MDYKTGEVIKNTSGDAYKTRDAAEKRANALKMRGVMSKVVSLGDKPEDGFGLKVVQVGEATAQMKRRRLPIMDRDVLTAPQRKGFVRRFVNDVGEGTRIRRFIEAGYDIVTGPVPVGDERVGSDNPEGSPVRKSVGGGMHAVLMEIPEEWYEEDQTKKQEQITKQENQMRRKGGSVESAQKNKDRTYGGIQITR